MEKLKPAIIPKYHRLKFWVLKRFKTQTFQNCGGLDKGIFFTNLSIKCFFSTTLKCTLSEKI